MRCADLIPIILIFDISQEERHLREERLTVLAKNLPNFPFQKVSILKLCSLIADYQVLVKLDRTKSILNNNGLFENRLCYSRLAIVIRESNLFEELPPN